MKKTVEKLFICLFLSLLINFFNSSSRSISCLNSYYKDDSYINFSIIGIPYENSTLSGSNNCLISIFDDRIDGRIIISTSIDNLIKGSAGQAIQNMNIMFDFDESEGLTRFGMYP